MFGLFKSPPFSDASLGVLVRSRGHWRGTVLVQDGRAVPLAVSGGRRQPDADALALAREVPGALPHWRPAIEAAVWEHITPYVEALAAGELPAPEAGLPAVQAAREVGPFLTFTYVAVVPLAGQLVTELGLTIPWDEEHTLGARFRAGTLVELCGSVLHP